MRQWIKRPIVVIPLALLAAAVIVFGFTTFRSRQAEAADAAAESAAKNAAFDHTMLDQKNKTAPSEEITAEITTGVTTAEPETTTEEPTTAAPQKPSTKAEIIAYFNESVNRVKAERPGYTWSDRVVIDRNSINCSNKLLDAVAPTILDAVKGIAKFGVWQPQAPVARGADHTQFPVSGKSWASRLEPGFVKSATCTESGSSYQIKIVLRDEDVAVLPSDASTLRTGKVMNAWDAGLREDAKAAEPFVTITGFGTNYRDASVTCTIDKATGGLKAITYVLSCIFEVDVKQFGSAHASVMFGREETYTIN